MKGLRVCRHHGGNSIESIRKSARARLENDLQRFAQPVEKDHPLANPVQALLMEHRRCIARIQWLDEAIGRLETEELDFGLTQVEEIGASEFPGVNTRRQARIHALVDLQNREREHFLRVESLIFSVGFEQARLTLQTNTTRVIAQIVESAVKSLGHDLTDPKVRKALHDAVQQIAPPEASDVLAL